MEEQNPASKLPPREGMLAYAEFFATRLSLGPEAGRWCQLESFTPEEQAAYKTLLRRIAAAARRRARGRGGRSALPGQTVMAFHR